MKCDECNRCGAKGKLYFTEIFEPLSEELRTYWLCADCQFDLAMMMEKGCKT